MKPSEVAVGVPTWNSAETLVRCLAPLCATFHDIHIYDRFSTDGTIEIARRARCIVHLHDEPIGPTRARMIMESPKPYLLMVDSDNVMSPEQIQMLLDGYDRMRNADSRTAAVQFLNMPIWEPSRSYLLWELGRWDFPILNPKRLDTACLLMSVERARGFKCAETMYEDMLLGRYLYGRGYSCYILGEAHPIHLLSRADTFKHWRRGAKGLLAYEKHTPFSLARQIGEIALTRKIPSRYKRLLIRQRLEWIRGMLELWFSK
jgi:glycosyltransferase involved in cell wall biosynthesis